MSAIKTAEYINQPTLDTEKSDHKLHSPLDILSHELRTPLHAISGYTDFLQAAPSLLLRVARKLSTMPWKSAKKKLMKTASLLKDNLGSVHTNLVSLEAFVSAGKYQAFSHELKAIGTSAITPLTEFAAEQRTIAQCYTALNKGHALLEKLVASEPLVDKSGLANQLQALAKNLKTHLSKAKIAANHLNTLIPTGWGQLPSDTEESSRKTPPAQQIRVLVVDDNAINRQLVGKHLKKEGLYCDFAENGAQAVAQFAPEKYAAIFMDIMMPVMDGYKATQAIREIEKAQACKAIPILALTAIAPSLENKAHVLAAGMDDFISKPFSAAHIKRLVKQHVFNQPTSPSSSDSDDGFSPSPLLLPRSVTLISEAPLKTSKSAPLLTACGFHARRNSFNRPSSEATLVTTPESVTSSPPTSASLLGVIGFMAHRTSVSILPAPPALTVTTIDIPLSSSTPVLASIAE